MTADSPRRQVPLSRPLSALCNLHVGEQYPVASILPWYSTSFLMKLIRSSSVPPFLCRKWFQVPLMIVHPWLMSKQVVRPCSVKILEFCFVCHRMDFAVTETYPVFDPCLGISSSKKKSWPKRVWIPLSRSSAGSFATRGVDRDSHLIA